MDWFLVSTLMILLWAVSLGKVIFASRSQSNVALLSNSEEDGRKRKVMLVVAHPDDEAMFFAPTIVHLISEGHSIHILCLSTGNADGKGNIRKEELYHASTTLKVPHQQIKVLDHPELQDGFDNAWSSILVANIIKEEVISRGIDLLITFDRYGISGHRNHRDVHNGVNTFLSSETQCIEAWELVTTSIIRKYSGPVDVWLSILSATNSKGKTYCLMNKHPLTSFIAMSQHQSQWVWYRKLFVLFASYSYLNVLRKINM
ncbi:N-acetylglucosaminylphosphatidylinositol deacetylase [Ranunculus cassubicifolius]